MKVARAADASLIEGASLEMVNLDISSSKTLVDPAFSLEDMMTEFADSKDYGVVLYGDGGGSG
jgi:hypothetical protein